MRPERRKRTESAASGGASSTIIRAEAKAEDHMKAKASPMAIARMSMAFSSRSGCIFALPGRRWQETEDGARHACGTGADRSPRKRKGRPRGGPSLPPVRQCRHGSAVDRVLERLRHGDLHDLVGGLRHRLAGGRVAHLAFRPGAALHLTDSEIGRAHV